MLPLAAKLAGLAGTGALLFADNKAEREKIKKMAQEDKEKAERESEAEKKRESRGMKKGGTVKSASKRADGCAQRGKTKGRYI